MVINNSKDIIQKNVSSIDWQKVGGQMDETGYALVPRLLPSEICKDLVEKYDKSDLYRKTIIMERYRFGVGEYKYFRYPLPSLIETIRNEIYSNLVPIANKWMKLLNIKKEFPEGLNELQRLCHENNQSKPTVLILKYGKGGYNTLHQDLYGEIFFPFQAIFFLNSPETDYTGGEFILMQQNPRSQSKAMVLKPNRGDMLIITTNFRPVKGNRGYYQVRMKHGVSDIHEGKRHTLGIIFHDATN